MQEDPEGEHQENVLATGKYKSSHKRLNPASTGLGLLARHTVQASALCAHWDVLAVQPIILPARWITTAKLRRPSRLALCPALSDECQPTKMTRFWASASAGVFGCAGS